MLKDQLLDLMKDWPDETHVIISSWPFVCEIQAVQCKPENGIARIVLDRESWRMKSNDQS